MGKCRSRTDRKGRTEVTAPSRVQMKWVGEHNFDTGLAGRPTVRLDGDGRTGPSPVDALLGALAACTGVDIVDILAKRRTPVESLDVDIVGERVDDIPRRFKHITLNYRIGGAGIERVHAERAVELAVTKYCSVRDSLRPDVPIEWTIELESEKK
jgi:putative redox protein